jgi:hypothetical protein
MSIESLLERLVVATETLAREATSRPTPAAPKPRTPAKPAAEIAAAPAPAESAPNTGPAPGAVQPAEPIKAAAIPAKEPTLDDVRLALVECQTRKGGKDVPQAILAKHTAPKAGTTGNLPKDKYATVIAECAAA